MKLSLQFSIHEPKREVTWWGEIISFPTLVTFRSRKFELLLYEKDPTGKADYNCVFSAVPTYDPNWHATTYHEIDYLVDGSYVSRCDCGAAHTSFDWDHMKFCSKWTKW